MAQLRDELLANLSGDIVEVGAGDGMNFSHYPASVASVIALEPEPHLRGLAERAARGRRTGAGHFEPRGGTSRGRRECRRGCRVADAVRFG